MTPTIQTIACSLLPFVLACAPPSQEARERGRVPIVGEPCEGCEAIFEGMPEELSSEARIAPADEPGTPLRIVGRVVDRDGEPAHGTIVYAYHTNAEGVYPRNEQAPGLRVPGHPNAR